MNYEYDQFSDFLLLKKWHPDRCSKNSSDVGEYKRRFQRIQEAYSGLFKKKKKRSKFFSFILTNSYAESINVV